MEQSEQILHHLDAPYIYSPLASMERISIEDRIAGGLLYDRLRSIGIGNVEEGVALIREHGREVYKAYRSFADSAHLAQSNRNSDLIQRYHQHANEWTQGWTGWTREERSRLYSEQNELYSTFKHRQHQRRQKHLGPLSIESELIELLERYGIEAPDIP